MRGVVLLMLVAAIAGSARAGSFTDKADGDYDSTGQTTWNESGTPGGDNGPDTVTINSHTVTMTAAGDGNQDTVTVNGGVLSGNTSNAFNGCVVTVNPGGTVYRNGTITDLLAGGTINLNGGTMHLVHGDHWGGDVRVLADSAIRMSGNHRALSTIDSLELTHGVTLLAEQDGRRLGVAGRLLMSGDATITVTNVTAGDYSYAMEAASISGTGTLTKTGMEALVLTAAATDFSGAVIVDQDELRLDGENALSGASLVTVKSGCVLHSRGANALNGCTVMVNTGGLLRTGTDAVGALSGSVVHLNSGTNLLHGRFETRHFGGEMHAYGNSTMQIRGMHNNQSTVGRLWIHGGAYLLLDQESGYLGVTGAVWVAGSGTLDIFSDINKSVQIAGMRSFAGQELVKAGDKGIDLNNTMGIRLLGNADLIRANSFVMITNAEGTVTDNTTWEDSTMWTKGGSPATAITATLVPSANKGTIDNAHGGASFASSDLGYVTVEGLQSGGGANARLVIIEFDAPSDLDDIRSRLEAAHPDWTEFFQKGANKIGFTLEPTSDGTGYFGWDNKHGDLGADVVGIWFGPPDRGTVIQIL